MIPNTQKIKENEEHTARLMVCAKNADCQQLRNHNISEEDYKEQLNKQGVCCACCGKPFDVELPCIDHRHNVDGCTHPQEVGCSTCFRSLMHNKCNAALGHLGDDPDTAIECMLRLKKVMKSLSGRIAICKF